MLIDRKNPRRAIASIREGLQTLPADWSLVIFPEGTRSPDGRLGRFKKGAFHIAVESRLPVVPIATCGAPDLLPPKAWLVRPGTIQVYVGPPMVTESWHTEDAEIHLAEMRAAIESCLEEARRRHKAARTPTAA